MPITFIKNKDGTLLFNSPLIIDHSAGWWNSITSGDFDEDGDTDYIIGNLGLNTRHKASATEPLCIYAKDFDMNGGIDPVMCYYVQGKNYTYPSRDEMINQIPAMRKRFNSYKGFASVTFEETFTKQELSGAFIVKTECLESSYLENKGNGKFGRKALPLQCQFAPLFGMITGDYNSDGHLDILMTGNSYSTEVSTGNYDAMSGLLLPGDGKGNFQPVNSNTTGFNANADSKGMAQIYLANNSPEILVANNNDKLQGYEFIKSKGMAFRVNQNDVYAIVHKKDGTSFKQELYFGSGYLSNTSRMLCYSYPVTSVTIYDNDGKKREVAVNLK
jgi:hypothetical protein